MNFSISKYDRSTLTFGLELIIIRYTYNVETGFIVQTVRKDCHDEHINYKRNQQRDASLDEIIHICFSYFLRFSTVDISRLKIREKSL